MSTFGTEECASVSYVKSFSCSDVVVSSFLVACFSSVFFYYFMALFCLLPEQQTPMETPDAPAGTKAQR